MPKEGKPRCRILHVLVQPMVVTLDSRGEFASLIDGGQRLVLEKDLRHVFKPAFLKSVMRAATEKPAS